MDARVDVCRPVPRWADRVAHAIPFCVLPSGVWRLAVAFGFSMGMLDDAGHTSVLRGWPAVYVAIISVLSEAVALTAFGLVRPWGEVAPTWLPFIGGRPVRPRAAIIPATVGSVALVLIWTVGFWEVWTGAQASQMASPFWGAVFAACYAPLNLWGPALLLLTWAYARRRSGTARYEAMTRADDAAAPPVSQIADPARLTGVSDHESEGWIPHEHPYAPVGRPGMTGTRSGS